MTLKIDDIIEIHKKIKPQIRWTETSYSQSISDKTNSNIYIKYENRQHTGSFKARGSFAKLASIILQVVGMILFLVVSFRLENSNL